MGVPAGSSCLETANKCGNPCKYIQSSQSSKMKIWHISWKFHGSFLEVSWKFPKTKMSKTQALEVVPANLRRLRLKPISFIAVKRFVYFRHVEIQPSKR